MKRLILFSLWIAFTGSAAHAGTIINVPAGGSIQAAIDSASDGDTITLTSSATYVGNLRISKPIYLVARPGEYPRIQNADNSTTSQLILLPGSSGTQIGSLYSGKITFQYLKLGIASGATLPTGMIRVDQTTGSQFTLVHADVISTGPTTYGMPSGVTHGPNPSTVTLRYVNIDLNRTDDYNAGGVSADRAFAYGIEIGDTHGYTRQASSLGGPTYNLDHVRIKGYVRAGVWIQYTSSTLNMHYCDVGTLGEVASAGGSPNIPWGPFVAFYYWSTYTGRISHSAFQGPGAYHGFGSVGPNGTSVTLSRCVLVSKMTSGQTTYGAFFASNGSTATPPGPLSSKCRVTIDHCDIVDLSPAVGTSGEGSALLKNSANVNQLVLNITNSNIYSRYNRPINFTAAGSDVFTSRYNNVYGIGANVGYTAGEGDLAWDPIYQDPDGLDFRYHNNTLAVSDAVGCPIGTRADYGDVTNGIISGFHWTSRAHGWEMLK